MILFSLVGASGGDNSDRTIPLLVAVAHNDDPRPEAHPKKDKSIFVGRMFGIVEYGGPFVIEGALSLLER